MNLFAAIALASLAAAPVPKGAAKSDQDAIQGEWKMVEFRQNGNDLSKDEELQFRLVIKGDDFTFKEKSGDTLGTFTIDPKADPKTIDITWTPRGNEKIVVKRGIYKLEQDKLTICYRIDSAPRPGAFKAGKDDFTNLFVFERVKK